MSDDRSSSSQAHRHRNSRWGVSAPQRALLALFLCIPCMVRAQGAAEPALIQPGHAMHGMPNMPDHPAAPGESATAPPSGAPTLLTPAVEPNSPIRGFSPTVTGPNLAPSIAEDEANKRFGIEEALAAARASTSKVNRPLAKPIDAGIAFHGPLWTVKKDKLDTTVRGHGTIEINEDTLHDAVITQSGVVRGLYVFPGMEVKAGDPLTSIYSPERVNAQHMLLADFSKDEGNQISLEYYSSFSSAKKYLEHSRSNLKWWGFSDADIDTLLKTEKVKEDYVFAADQDSFIVETLKSPGAVVVAGDKSEENFVVPGEQIMRMAKLDSVWGMGFVKPRDDGVFKLGDTLDVTVGEGKQARVIAGLIVHKHDNADQTTRRADFHVLLDNRDRSIAPGSLVSFSKRLTLEGIWIPTRALLDVGGQATVVRKGAKGYDAVGVTIGASSGEFSQVIAGLNEGDQVVESPRAELNPDARLPGLSSWQ